MAMKTLSVKIDGTLYNIQHMQVSQALSLFRELSALFKDGFEPLVAMLSGDEGAIPLFIQGLVSQLSDVELESLIKRIILGTVVIGSTRISDEVYETQFAGSFDVLIRLLFEVLKHNYESFLKIGAIEVIPQDN